MRILFLSSTYPPDRCGVGDHSFKIKSELSLNGAVVDVVKDLNQINFSKHYDAILVQYTPSLWPSFQYPFSLIFPFKLFRIRKKIKAPLFLIVHELYYPLFLDLKGFFLGVLQRTEFLLLNYFCDWSFFTYQKPQLFYKKKSSVLPVGSNISKIDFKKNDENKKIRLVHFGGHHPTHLLDWAIDALVELQKNYREKSFELEFIGLSHEKLKKILVGHEDLAVYASGYVSEQQVSEKLQMANIALAPFWDGVSTRRGSVMAALQHCIPVFTTDGYSTDSSIPWKNFVFLSKAPHNLCDQEAKNAYIKLLKKYHSDQDQLEQKVKNAQMYYEKNFSWKVLVDKIIFQIEHCKYE